LDNVNWDLAGISDNKMGLDTFGAHHAIWAPPNVELDFVQPDNVIKNNANLSRIRFKILKDKRTPVILYPLPKNWNMLVSQPNLIELLKSGWKVKDEAPGLLNDFLKLSFEEIKEKDLYKVRDFVIKWGPLWICRNPKDEHDNCYWSIQGTINRPESPCFWAPVEEVTEFVREAWEAKSVLDAAAKLFENKPVPDNIWRKMGFAGTESVVELRLQRFFVASTVNGRLSKLGGPSTWLKWENDQKPSLQISSGKGFLNAVWIQVAQRLSGSKNIYQCDGCGEFYIRTGRKPQKGRKNYCKNCGERAAKRVWKAENNINR